MLGSLVRVVLDTNILISALYFGGTPKKVFELWEGHEFELIASVDMLDEYEEVLYRMHKKLKKQDETYVDRTMKSLTEECVLIQPRHRKKYSRDPDDDKFIHCAQSGKAIYIVSGDSDLLDLDKIDDIEIVTARKFLNRIQDS